MDDGDGLSYHERLRIQQIRELDMEELQIEIVGDDSDQSSDDAERDHLLRGSEDGGSGPYQEFTFNRNLTSLHSYLGDIEDIHGRNAFFDGGIILTLAMFYLEGIVLFPEATLPLRVTQPSLKAAVERSRNQVDAPNIIGVVGTSRLQNGGIRFGTIGTSAEIRQYKRMDNGVLNVVARGRQRFYLRRQWTDVEGAACAEVQIIQEDTPIRTPRSAFAQLASVSSLQTLRRSSSVIPNASARDHIQDDVENELECMSNANIPSDQSPRDRRRHTSPGDSSIVVFADSGGSDDECVYERGERVWEYPEKTESHYHKQDMMCEGESTGYNSSKHSTPIRKAKVKDSWEDKSCQFVSTIPYRAPMSFWPHWVYEMYDSYSLARRTADMWKQIIGTPKIDDLVNKPDILSFYIASRLPLSQDTRQELLEIDGVSYRLRRELQLLERFNLVRCKYCSTVIAKRSDMLVMSSDGPLNAYVNPHGYVCETMTFYHVHNLARHGRPVKEHSWFPGYAWTITNCDVCESHMGWLFTATNKKLRPEHFWGRVMGDTTGVVKRLGEFLGFPFSDQEIWDGAVEKIVELCSFDNLSNLEVSRVGKFDVGVGIVDNNVFFRRGKVGDWRNQLKPEMAERLDAITEEKLKGSGLTFKKTMTTTTTTPLS